MRSAKAVKITDMDLIKRLGAIVGMFVLFLIVRTLVSPPKGEECVVGEEIIIVDISVIIGRTADDLKAFLCESNWWDHSFTISENNNNNNWLDFSFIISKSFLTLTTGGNLSHK